MADGAPGAEGVTNKESAGRRRRDEMRRTLDDALSSMISHYEQILKAARVESGEAQTVREDLQTQVHAASIVAAGKKITGLVSELMEHRLCFDFPAMTREVEAMQDSYLRTKYENMSRGGSMALDVATRLKDLENRYYASAARGVWLDDEGLDGGDDHPEADGGPH